MIAFKEAVDVTSFHLNNTMVLQKKRKMFKVSEASTQCYTQLQWYKVAALLVRNQMTTYLFMQNSLEARRVTTFSWCVAVRPLPPCSLRRTVL